MEVAWSMVLWSFRGPETKTRSEEEILGAPGTKTRSEEAILGAPGTKTGSEEGILGADKHRKVLGCAMVRAREEQRRPIPKPL